MRYGFEPLNVVDNPFYFGIGGMGDFLLLMSTFYDGNKRYEVSPDVIFVCNDVTAIRKLAKKFDRINRFWFYPRKAFNIGEQQWHEIHQHHLCQGTGVTPAKFDYVGEWIKCGTTFPDRGCFSFYGVKEYPYFCHPTESDEKYFVIQPFGGCDDSTKRKEIPGYALDQITTKAYDDGCKVIFIGSPKDAAKLPINDMAKESGQARWVTDIGEAYELIRACHTFYGADSWGKTVACFAGKQTIVYPNLYAPGRGPMEMFNHPVDPGDYIFLEGWKLEVLDKC